MEHYEIERKYLIRIPSRLGDLPSVHMEQTYLVNPAATERVRKIIQNGVTVWRHTFKKRVSGMTCIEDEREIPETAALALLQRPRVGRTVVKDRYFYDYEGHTFEIDVYPFWRRQCVMEVEMKEESEPVRLPPDVTVIREVTGQRRYKNAALAREIPEEDL